MDANNCNRIIIVSHHICAMTKFTRLINYEKLYLVFVFLTKIVHCAVDLNNWLFINLLKYFSDITNKRQVIKP